jgi:hypothetical protein
MQQLLTAVLTQPLWAYLAPDYLPAHTAETRSASRSAGTATFHPAAAVLVTAAFLNEDAAGVWGARDQAVFSGCLAAHLSH